MGLTGKLQHEEHHKGAKLQDLVGVQNARGCTTKNRATVERVEGTDVR